MKITSGGHELTFSELRYGVLLKAASEIRRVRREEFFRFAAGFQPDRVTAASIAATAVDTVMSQAIVTDAEAIAWMEISPEGQLFALNESLRRAGCTLSQQDIDNALDEMPRAARMAALKHILRPILDGFGNLLQSDTAVNAGSANGQDEPSPDAT